MIWGLLLWACAGPAGCGTDPSLQPFVDAAAAVDEGMAAMEQGDTERALERFAAAEALDPQSPVLPAWRARALEEAGREAEALAVLDQALLRFPRDATLRFNRAGLRARTGELELAALDLVQLGEQGQLNPEEAGSDPDLARLRERPEIAALVPAARLDARLTGQEGSVLLGERFTAWLEILLPTDYRDLSIRAMGEPSGLLRRERVVEDQLVQEGRGLFARVELSFRGVAPGSGEVGPWLLTTGGGSALTDHLPVQVVAVGARREASTPGPEDLVLPSALLAGREPPWIGELDGRLVLLGRPAQGLQVQGVDGAEVPALEEWELRREGQPAWRARLYLPSGPAQARISEGSRELLASAWPLP